MNSSSRNLLAPGKYLYLCFLIYHVGLWQMPCLIMYFKLSVSGSFHDLFTMPRHFSKAFDPHLWFAPTLRHVLVFHWGLRWQEMTMKAWVLEGRFSLHLSGNIIALVFLGLGWEMRGGEPGLIPLAVPYLRIVLC